MIRRRPIYHGIPDNQIQGTHCFRCDEIEVSNIIFLAHTEE